METSVILKTGESTTSSLDFVKSFTRFLIGQPNAEKFALDMIERINNPLRNRKQPIGVYAIIGPTGTGKTRTAKTLARLLHQDETALTKIDCADYIEDHQMTDLKGGAVTYKGHVTIAEVKKLKPDEVDATSRISPHNLNRVRRFSTCGINIVLLDEFEKGCDELYKFFMGIFDDGTCTFANGIEGDFSNTIFILTMNLGMGKAEQLSKGGLGFNSQKRDLSTDELASIITKEMEKRFVPEFRNRLDGTLIYRNLTADQMLQVVDVEVADVIERIFLDLPQEQQFALQISVEAKQYMLDRSLDGSKEIRDLKRTIERLIVNNLGRELAKGTLMGGDLVTVRYNATANELVFHCLQGGGKAILQTTRYENGYIDGAWSSDAVGRKKEDQRPRIRTKKADQKLLGEKSVSSNSPDSRNSQSSEPRFCYDIIGYGKHMTVLQDEAEALQEDLLFKHRLETPSLLFEYAGAPLFILSVEATEEQINKVANLYPNYEIKARYQL